MKKATVENVLGDFENQNFFEFAGVKTEMSRRNGEYFIKFERGGEIENYKIDSVVGDKRVEEYVAEKDGEFLRLPVGYDLQKKLWTNLNAAYFDPDGEDFFKHLKNWKADCAACHLAGQNQSAANSQTSNAEFSALTAHSETQNDLGSDASLLACGSCHAKDLTGSMPKFAAIISSENLVRQTISAHQADAHEDASHFFADGSIRLTAHEYQGVLRSVCYLKSKADGTKIGGEKINCLSCHTPVNGNFDVANDEKLHTNQICTSCHQQFSDEKSVTEHTKHFAVSEANNCAACHLPEIVYGNLSFQKTHEISVPNPELTAAQQVPNACNQCHTDKSVNWAITQTKNLWTERFRDAKISVDSQFDEPEGVRGLFAGDAFTRAWAANNLAKHSDSNWSKPFLFRALENENYPLVRYFLANSLKNSSENSAASDFLFTPDEDNIIRRLKQKRPVHDVKIEE